MRRGWDRVLPRQVREILDEFGGAVFELQAEDGRRAGYWHAGGFSPLETGSGSKTDPSEPLRAGELPSVDGHEYGEWVDGKFQILSRVERRRLRNGVGLFAVEKASEVKGA